MTSLCGAVTAISPPSASQLPQSLALAAGVFARDHADVAGHGFAIRKAARVAQKYLGRQRRHRAYARMCQQAERLWSLLGLFFHLPVQLLDPFLQLVVQAQQLVSPLTGVRS